MQLVILLLVSIYPILIAYLYIRFSKSSNTIDPTARAEVVRSFSNINLPVFLGAIAAGVVSTVLAAIVQGAIPIMEAKADSRTNVLFYVFVRIALTEETMRLFCFILFFVLIKKVFKIELTKHEESACGLTIGLSFASVETALIAASNSSFVLLRIITAAPLHGACGERIAAAVTNKPFGIKNIVFFFGAILLHGFYDAMLLSERTTFIVIAVLLTIMTLIKFAGSNEDK
ncbi:MAG: hypothetical protein Ta2G_10280 [Termitinemataceae bacterium]|nr:MAG: hypothetical protein Ta2G_10280 [Termitinemataceae bacterium]